MIVFVNGTTSTITEVISSSSVRVSPSINVTSQAFTIMSSTSNTAAKSSGWTRMSCISRPTPHPAPLTYSYDRPIPLVDFLH